ncbi:MAG: type II toxin-antitoxin system RelE/ParE family toxin [Sulfurovaceae bacterium]
MNYKIVITEYYLKKLKKFVTKHLEVLDRYIKMIEILEIDPFHPSLRIHKLKGRLKEYHSISINMQYRVVIDFIIDDGMIIPIDIGTHDDVY